MASILFIGLGHMGLPMSISLLGQGHDLIGYDLVPAARDQLKQKGGQVLNTLDDLSFSVDVLITMLQTGEQVKDICIGEVSLYSKLSVHGLKLHIDCSSIDVESSRLLYTESLKYGVAVLDAPVSGGVKGAKQSTLTFMVGGDDIAFAQAKPILMAMGQNIYHTGANGTGQAAKICNNMILGISMIAVSEAFCLAEKLGLSHKKLFEVVNHSSGQCWAMSSYTPVPNLLPDVPANHNYKPGFTAAMMLKDLKLSQDAAEKNQVITEMGKKATILYQAFTETDNGHLDFSAIIKAIKK